MACEQITFTKEAEGIYSFDFVPPELCRDLVDHLAANDAWRFATGANTKMLTAKLLHSHGISTVVFDQFDHAFDSRLKQALRERLQLELPEHWAVTARRYAEGQSLRKHWDDSENREYSLLCYLNDDCLGGQTYFFDSDLTVPPSIGRALVFDARLLHCGLKVHKGEKHVLFAALGKELPSDPSATY